MSRIVHEAEAVVVEMHDRPGFAPDDGERIKQTLWLAGRQHARLVIDCADVEVVGGDFLSALLVAMKRLGARSGDIVLCNLRPAPLQVLQVTRLDRAFPLCASREEALQAAWPDPQPYIVEADALTAFVYRMSGK